MSEAVANNGNDLIVGFSVRRRRTASDTDSKQVSLSQDITKNFFQCPSREEVFKRWRWRWYSERDKSIFEQEMQRQRDIQSTQSLSFSTGAHHMQSTNSAQEIKLQGGCSSWRHKFPTHSVTSCGKFCGVTSCGKFCAERCMLFM
jgi:hypothetical protein